MRSGTNNASQEASWSFRGKARLAFVGALVVLVAGLCLVTLSGCSISPAHALGGSVVKDSQAEQNVQVVGGNSSGLSQAYQGVWQKCSDANNDGICDNCGNDSQGCAYCSSNYVDANNNGICDHREYTSENHRAMNGTGANGSDINGTGANGVGANSSWDGQAGSAGKGNSCQKGFARHCA